MGSKWMIRGVFGLAVALVIWLGYRHYTGLLDEVQELHAAQAQMETVLDVERQSVRSLQSVIESWEQSQAALEETLQQMQEESDAARAEARRLRQLFSEIDLESMSPAAADSIADTTSDRLWRLIQEATRSGGPGNRPGAGSESEPTEAGAGSSPGS